MKYLITALFITACSTGSNEPVPHSNDLSSLKVISEEIEGELPERQDSYGWINSDRCDSLLYSGILYCVDDSVDIIAGKDQETDQWFRTPFKDCYRNYKSQRNSTRQSKSTVSRDGFTGLARAFSCDAVLGAKESRRILEYGRRHNWIMGEGLKTRTILSPNLQRTFALMADEPEPLLPDVWLLSDSNSERHLAVLHIWVRGKIVGSITNEMLDAVTNAFKDAPRNAFFSLVYHAYTDGDQSETIDLILDLYPNTSCKSWLWNNDESQWSDCDQTNSNVEFLFLIKELEELYGNA